MSEITFDLKLRTIVDQTSLKDTKETLKESYDDLAASPVAGMQERIDALKSLDMNSFIPNFGNEFATQVSVIESNVGKLIGLYNKIGQAQTKYDRSIAVDSYIGAQKRAATQIQDLQNSYMAMQRLQKAMPSHLITPFTSYFQQQGGVIRGAYGKMSAPNKSGITYANGSQLAQAFAKGFLQQNKGVANKDLANFISSNSTDLAEALLPLMASGFNRDDLIDSWTKSRKESVGSIKQMLPEAFRKIELTKTPEWKKHTKGGTSLNASEWQDLKNFVLSNQDLLEEFELAGIAKRQNGQIRLASRNQLTRQNVNALGGRLVSLFEAGARGIAPTPDKDIEDVNDPKYFDRIQSKNNMSMISAKKGMNIIQELFPWVSPEYIDKIGFTGKGTSIGTVTAKPRYKAASYTLLPFEGGEVKNLPVVNSLMQQRLSKLAGADQFVHNGKNTNEIYVQMPVEELQDFETTPERRNEIKQQIAQHIASTKRVNGNDYVWTGFTGSNAVFTRKDLYNQAIALDPNFFTNGEDRRQFTSAAQFGKAVDYMQKQRTDGENIRDLYGTDLSKAKVVVADWKKITGADGQNLISNELVPASFQGRDVSGKSTYFTFSMAGLREKYKNFIDPESGDLVFPTGGINGGELRIPENTQIIEDKSNIKNYNQYEGLSQEEVNAARSKIVQEEGIFAKATADSASVNANYISSQAASSMSLDQSAREYFRQIYAERMAALRNPDAVKRLLFSGTDALSMAINSPGGEALLQSDEAQERIRSYARSITHSVAEGNLLLPEGAGEYKLLGAWIPDIFNSLAKDDPKLTEEQKSWSLRDFKDVPEGQDPSEYVKHRVAYYQSMADKLMTFRNPNTASGNQEVINEAATELFQSLAKDFGLDTNALYTDPASKILQKWQTADQDGDTVFVSALKNNGAFGAIMASVLAKTAMDYEDLINLSGRTPEQQEAYNKSRVRSLEDEEGKVWDLNNPQDLAEWFIRRQMPAAKMGAAHTVSIGARQYAPNGLMARAIFNAEGHYDQDSNGAYKLASEWMQTPEEWDVLLGGNPFYRLNEWRNKFSTAENVPYGDTEHMEKVFLQERFNKKKIDAVNFPSIYDPHGLQADFTTFTASRLNPETIGSDVQGGDWADIFGNLPEVSKNEHVAALQNRLRELRQQKLEGKFLGFEDSLVQELGYLATNAYNAIEAEVKSDSSISQAEQQKEIEKRWRDAGGLVPKHLKEWGLTRSNVEKDPALFAEMQKAENLFGKDAVWAKAKEGFTPSYAYFSAEEIKEARLADKKRKEEEARKALEQRQLELEAKKQEAIVETSDELPEEAKTINAPTKEQTPKPMSYKPKQHVGGFGPGSATLKYSDDEEYNRLQQEYQEAQKERLEAEKSLAEIKEHAQAQAEFNRILQAGQDLSQELYIGAKGKENKLVGRSLAHGYYNKLFYGQVNPQLEEMDEYIKAHPDDPDQKKAFREIRSSIMRNMYEDFANKGVLYSKEYADAVKNEINEELHPTSGQKKKLDSFEERAKEGQGFIDFINNRILNNPDITLTSELQETLGKARAEIQKSLVQGAADSEELRKVFTKENEENSTLSMEQLQGQLGYRDRNSIEAQVLNRHKLIQKQREQITQNHSEGLMSDSFYQKQMDLLQSYDDNASLDIIKKARESLGIEQKTSKEKADEWGKQRLDVLQEQRNAIHMASSRAYEAIDKQESQESIDKAVQDLQELQSMLDQNYKDEAQVKKTTEQMATYEQDRQGLINQQQLDAINRQNEANLLAQQRSYDRYNEQRKHRGSHSRMMQYIRQDENHQRDLQDSIYANQNRIKTEEANIARWKQELGYEGRDKSKDSALLGNIDQTTKKIDGYKDAIQKAEKEQSKFSKSSVAFDAAFTSISQSASMLATRFGRQLFSKAINEVKQFVKEYDKSMTEIQMITLKSDTDITELGQKLIGVAKNTGSTVSDVTSAAANLYRQGLSDEEVDERLDDVIKFSKVTGIKTTEASKIITTALQNGLVGNSEEAMDALTALGDSAATTASEIAKGMQKSAAAAKQSGMSYGELVTLLTIGTSKTQLGGSTIGSSLNTLMYRLYKVNNGEDFADENGRHIAATAATKALSKMGISLYDEEGKFRGPYQILQDIAAGWENADDTTQSMILTTLGAGRQRSNVATLLQGMAEDNGELAQKYLNTAEGSKGITDRKYDEYLDSLQAKLNGVKTSFDGLIESFSMGDAGKGVLEWVSSFIDGLTEANSALNGMPGTILAIGAAVTVLTGLIHANPILAGGIAIVGLLAAAISGLGNTAKENQKYTQAGQIKQEQTIQKAAIEETEDDISRARELLSKKEELEKSGAELSSEDQKELSDILTRLGNQFNNLADNTIDAASKLKTANQQLDDYQEEINNRKKNLTKEAIENLPQTDNFADYMIESEKQGKYITPSIFEGLSDYYRKPTIGDYLVGEPTSGDLLSSQIYRRYKSFDKLPDYLQTGINYLYNQGKLGAYGTKDNYFEQLKLDTERGSNARKQLHDELNIIVEQGYEAIYEQYKQFIKDSITDYANEKIKPKLSENDIFTGDEISSIIQQFISNILAQVLVSDDLFNLDIGKLIFDETQRIASEAFSENGAAGYYSNLNLQKPENNEQAWDEAPKVWLYNDTIYYNKKDLLDNVYADHFTKEQLENEKNAILKEMMDENISPEAIDSYMPYLEDTALSRLALKNSTEGRVGQNGKLYFNKDGFLPLQEEASQEPFFIDAVTAGMSAYNNANEKANYADEVLQGISDSSIKSFSAFVDSVNDGSVKNFKSLLESFPELAKMLDGLVTQDENGKYKVDESITEAEDKILLSALVSFITSKSSDQHQYQTTIDTYKNAIRFQKGGTGNTDELYESAYRNIVGENLTNKRYLYNQTKDKKYEFSELERQYESDVLLNAKTGIQGLTDEQRFAGLETVMEHLNPYDENGVDKTWFDNIDPSVLDAYLGSYKELYQAVRSGNPEEVEKQWERLNEQFESDKIANLTKYSKTASKTAQTLTALNKGGKEAAQAIASLRKEEAQLNNAALAVKNAQGKSGSQLNTNERADLAAVTGEDEQLIKQMTKDEIERLRQRAQESIDQSFIEDFGDPIQAQLQSLMDNNPIALQLATEFSTDGSLDLSEISAIAAELGDEALAELASHAGTIGELLIEIEKQDMGEKAIAKVIKGAVSGTGKRMGGGGGGGGGKSAVDKLLEDQKHRLADVQHQNKMLEIQEKTYDYNNNYLGWKQNIDEQIKGQYNLKDAYLENIKEMEELLAKTKEGSEDYWKLKESINSTTEAVAELTNAINELAKKKLDVLSQQLDEFAKPGTHVTNMLQQYAQRAMGEDRFADYERFTLQQIDEKQAERMRAAGNAEMYKQELSDAIARGDLTRYDENGNETDVWIEYRDRIWAEEEKAAAADTEASQMQRDLEQQRLSQIAKIVQNNTQNLGHNKNIASSYASMYEAGGYRDQYEQMLRDQMNINSSIIAENVAGKAAVQARIDSGDIKEGTSAWFEAQEALNSYDETIQQLTIDNVGLGKSIIESDIAGINEQWEETAGAVSKVNDLLESQAQMYQKAGDYKAYIEALSKEYDNLGTIVESDKNALAQLIAMRDAGLAAGNLSPEDERMLNNEIAQAQARLQQNTNGQEDIDAERRKAKRDQETDWYEDIRREPEHVLSMLDTQSSRYLKDKDYEAFSKASEMQLGLINGNEYTEGTIKVANDMLARLRAQLDEAKTDTEQDDILKSINDVESYLLSQQNKSEDITRAQTTAEINRSAEGFSDQRRETTHVGSMLKSRMSEYLSNRDYEAYEVAAEMYLETLQGNEQKGIVGSIATDEAELARKRELYGQTSDVSEQRRLLDEINNLESKIQSQNSEIDSIKKQQASAENNRISERQAWEATNYEHNKQMLSYDVSKFQNYGELTNVQSGLEETNRRSRERITTLQGELEEWEERKKYVEAGSDEEKKITQEIIKRREEIKKEETEIENNNKALEETEQKLISIRKVLEDQIDQTIEENKKHEREMLSASVETQDTILEVLRDRYKYEQELRRKDLEKEKESLNEYKNMINERFNYRKKAAQDADKEEDLAELRRQLAIIEADPTRSKDAKELREKIADKEKEQAWAIAEDEINAENERTDEKIEGLDKFIQYNEETTEEYLKNANNFADEVKKIYQGTYEDLEDFMYKMNESFINSLPDAQKQFLQNWNDTWKMAKDIRDSNYANVAEVLDIYDEKGNVKSYEELSTGDYQKRYLDWNKANNLDYQYYVENGNTTAARGMEIEWENQYRDFLRSIKDDAVFDEERYDLGDIESKVGDLNDEMYKVNDVIPKVNTNIAKLDEDIYNLVDESKKFPSRIQDLLDSLYNPIESEAPDTSDKTPGYNTDYNKYKDMSTGEKLELTKLDDINTAVQKIAEDVPDEPSADSSSGGEQKESSPSTGSSGKKQEWHVHGTNPQGEVTWYGVSYATKQEAENAAKKAQANGWTVDDIEKFAHGGLVDYTGPAWVDGTKTRHESFLDSTDTALLRSMLDSYNKIQYLPIMSHIDSSAYGSNTSIGDINITINQAELKSDADVDKLAKQVGEAFTKQLQRDGLNLSGYAFM